MHIFNNMRLCCLQKRKTRNTSQIWKSDSHQHCIFASSIFVCLHAEVWTICAITWKVMNYCLRYRTIVGLEVKSTEHHIHDCSHANTKGWRLLQKAIDHPIITGTFVLQGTDWYSAISLLRPLYYWCRHGIFNSLQKGNLAG